MIADAEKRSRKSLRLGRRVVDMRHGSVPVDVLEERAKRAKLTRTITQEFFGDPLPGYSALDQARRKNDRPPHEPNRR